MILGDRKLSVPFFQTLLSPQENKPQYNPASVFSYLHLPKMYNVKFVFS